MTATVQTHPLISIRPEATVQEAAQLMNDFSIAALGLLNAKKRFFGILTERDITAFVSQGKDPTTSLVGDIANDFPVVVQGPLSVVDAIDRMRSAHIRHLIVQEDGECRIVSMRDFLAPPNSTSMPTTTRLKGNTDEQAAGKERDDEPGSDG